MPPVFALVTNAVYLAKYPVFTFALNGSNSSLRL